MRVACLAVGLAWAACAAAEEPLRLPWADGLSFMFTQAHGGRITTHFTKATLNAVDIAMPEGISIVAARGGVVEALAAHHQASPADEPLTYEGNFVRVRHGDGTAALYAHLQHRSVVVAQGQAVEAGQLLGYSGATGDVEAPHLHFALIRTEKNSAGWTEEISIPFKFYVGVPPVVFAPRAALRVKANYSSVAEMPRTPSEGSLVPWKRPTLEAGEELRVWGALGLWLAAGVAALAWFWNFSRR